MRNRYVHKDSKFTGKWKTFDNNYGKDLITTMRKI